MYTSNKKRFIWTLLFRINIEIQKTCLEFIDSVIFLISHQSLNEKQKGWSLTSLPINAADCLK